VNREARIWWLVEVITSSTRCAMNPHLSTGQILRLLGSGHRGYGITCQQIADRFGISRSQAWRDKRDAEAVAGLVWGGGCLCHLKLDCPRERPHRRPTFPRAAYTEAISRMESENPNALATRNNVNQLATGQMQMRERTPPPAELGALIRAGRRRRGWTQTQAAKTIGIARPYLSQLENGKRSPSWSVAEDIARHLFHGDRQTADRLVSWAVVARGRDWGGPEPVIIDGREILRVRDIPSESASWPHP
jgi:DNA-binding XRE family transcriptional regulator